MGTKNQIENPVDRILFVGLGSIGQRHLRLLCERHEEFDIHAYRSGKSDRDIQFEITEHYDLEKALATNPDVAFITNPTSRHVETATACAREGCHLFVEKPLSHSLEGVDRLIAEAEAQDLVTVMGCQLRYHPVLKRIRTLLDDTAIGQIRSFRAYAGSYLPDWRSDRDYRKSYSADPSTGGGVVLDLIHELDYAHWLFGDITRVQAWTGRISDLEIESEDLAEIIVETNTGTVGEIHLDYYRPEPRRTIEVVGAEGIIRGDLNEGSLKVTRSGQTRYETFDYERDDLFEEQLDEYLKHVQGGDVCENDLREGETILKIALEAREEHD